LTMTSVILIALSHFCAITVCASKGDWWGTSSVEAWCNFVQSWVLSHESWVSSFI
jgi:hypothetical protein